MTEEVVYFTERIISDPGILRGKPTVRGTRMPVYLIVGMIEAGQTIEEIIDDFPNLSREDVEAAIEFDAIERAHTETRAL